MTTLAMVLGAIPLAIAQGPGYEARQQIGWVITGGMTVGTLFTLFVIPCVFLFFHGSKRKILWQTFLRKRFTELYTSFPVLRKVH